MPRADLTAMLNRLDDDPQPAPKAEPSAPKTQQPGSKPQTKAPTHSKRAAKTAAATQPASPKDPATETPLYLRLERKETRLRVDQYEALTVHARRLNRAKGPGGERITENTLIRVAIDLLLKNADQLSGPDETSLRNSVSP
jgi:hypothetical protein